MRNKLPQMKLYHEEDVFLRHWIYDEMQYQDGQGPAKRFQVEHQLVPADIATLIDAGMPDFAEQEAGGLGPPPAEAPTWPWSDEACANRLAEARLLLVQKRCGRRNFDKHAAKLKHSPA